MIYRKIKEHIPKRCKKKPGEMFACGIYCIGYFSGRYTCWCPKCESVFYSLSPTFDISCKRHNTNNKTKDPAISLTYVQHGLQVNFQDLKPLMRISNIVPNEHKKGYKFISLTDMEVLIENKNRKMGD